jgi:catechol 2,3-dioxygenase-like lactoylglutathione lyase family enzyme
LATVADFRGLSRSAKVTVDLSYPPIQRMVDTLLPLANTSRTLFYTEEQHVKIELNHTIVPAHDKEQSARFYERIFGFKYEGPLGHFAPVRIESQSLSLDFDNCDEFQPHHYAFKVGESEFGDIFGRVKAEGLTYGSGPFTPDDMKTNDWNGGRGVYFRDPNGHLLELLTRDYTAATMADNDPPATSKP